MRPWHECFTDLGNAVKRPPTWVIENLLPTGLVFLGGPAKAQKSSLTVAISLLVAGYKCKALPAPLSRVKLGGPVMMWSNEADAGELRWIAEEGMGIKVQDNEGIIAAKEPWTFRLDKEDGRESLIAWLEERQPVLVVIDPFRDFHSADENDSGQMSEILSPLRHWAVSNDSCILVVHHAKKLADDRASYENGDLRGSSALFALANGVLILSPVAGGNTLVKATFKRGAGWERQMRFGLYGNIDANPHDELSETECAVMELIPRSGPIGATQDSLLKLRPAIGRPQMATILQKLLRNGYVMQGAMGLLRL